MLADKALFCDCGHEVRANDDDAFVDAIRRHAFEAHGIEFPVELAVDVARRAELVPSSEQTFNRGIGEEKR